MHKINSAYSVTPSRQKCRVKNNVTNLDIGLNLLGMFCHVSHIIYVIKLQVCQCDWIVNIIYFQMVYHIKKID